MLIVPQFLNKLLQDKDYSLISSNGLDSTYFKGFEKEFEFIDNHYKQFGNIPDTLTFLDKFPDFELVEVEETDKYLVDKLYEEYGFTKFANFIPELSKKVKEDSREAYSYLLSELNSLKPHSVCRGTDIIKHASERYEIFNSRKTLGDVATIKTGLPELDDIFGGWEYGDELVTVVARTNQGKSWLLMKFLVEAWKQGKTVGLYSGEMNHVKLGYRFDALFNHFSNKGLTWGAQTEGYKEYIDNLQKNPTPFHIITQKDLGGKPTVQKMRNFVEENHLDILGIDQYSLMADGRAKPRDPARLQLAHIAEDLFLLSSEYKIPVLGLAQANREGVKKEGEMDAPGLENIKESDDISHNSSKCIGMRQSSFGLVLDIIKNREGRVGDKLLYSWDIDVGHFAYIPTGGDAATPQRREVAMQESQTVYSGTVNFTPF